MLTGGVLLKNNIYMGFGHVSETLFYFITIELKRGREMRKYKILFIVLMLCSFFTSDFSSLEEPQSEIFDGMIVSVGEGGDYTNIQDGIDNVSNNGTVLIHPGD